MARRKRSLSEEERELWALVTRSDKRHRSGKPEYAPAEPKAKAPQVIMAPAFEPAPLPVFTLGERAKPRSPAPQIALSRPVEHHLRAAPLQMDAKAYGTMMKGKLKPEGRLDLHGMTLDEAHPALISFVSHSYAMGRRLVLVITGKGKLKDDYAPMPARVGILRHAVPQWLRLAPLGNLILEVRPAHITHGGIGAYYVYLKRRR